MLAGVILARPSASLYTGGFQKAAAKPHNADREPAIVITIILLLGLSIGPIKHFFGRGESHPRVFGINQLDQALERAPRVLTSKIANLVLVFRPPARVS